MSFSGINMAGRALLAHQRALEVTGQNIANVETPGYSRQIAVTRPLSGPGAGGVDRSGNPLAPGGGVDVVRVYRAHAVWLDRAAASLSAQAGQTEIAASYAGRVEDLLREPGTGGLHATLTRFFGAAGALASRPDDLAARDTLLRSGEAVALRFRELTDGLDRLQSDAAARFTGTVDQVNRLTEQIAGLSKTIRAAEASGAAPNELLDQRDALLTELVRKTGASVSGQEGGELVVSIGGRTLIQDDHVEPLAVAAGDAFGLEVDGEPLPVLGGELRGLEEWGREALPAYRASLAGMRDRLAELVNGLHAGGTGLEGSTGLPFFTADAAGNLTINSALTADPRRLAAGGGAAGDGSIAQALAGLGSPSGEILGGYGAFVAGVGARVSETRLAAEQSRAAEQQVRLMQASEAGVNLDEELSRMVSLQHAYAASARLLSTFDEMLGVLIQTGA